LHILTADMIRVPLGGGTQSGIVNALLDCEAAGGKVADRRAALEAFQKSETLASKVMEHGMAVPHVRSSAVIAAEAPEILRAKEMTPPA
jgi:mannitol/fructose-specific phosphotransferase system IIA component (Ntr-type)